MEAFLEVQREAGDRILESLEESCGTKLGEEVECGSLAAWHLDMEGVQLVGQEDIGRSREAWWRGLVWHLLAVLVFITVLLRAGDRLRLQLPGHLARPQVPALSDCGAPKGAILGCREGQVAGF